MKSYLIFSHEYPPFQGGIGNYAQGVAEAMHTAGINVRVITTGLMAEDGTDTDCTVPITRIQNSQHNSYAKFARELSEYAEIIKMNPTAHLHAMDWQSWKLLSTLNLFEHAPYSLTLHGSEIMSTSRSWRVRLLGLDMPFRNVTDISVNSQDTRRRLLEYFPSQNDREIRIAHPSPQKELINLAPSLPPPEEPNSSPLIFLTVARIEPRKGHLHTLKALRSLSENSNVKIEWRIVGESIESDYFDELKAQSKTLPFKATLLGKLSNHELAKQYEEADVFILTGTRHKTKSEGFGMVYIEAGLFGLPSVATNVGGVSEAVKNGHTGLMSESGDDIKLKNNLLQIYNDTKLRHELGKQAYEHARSFSWRKTAASIFPSVSDNLHE